MDIEYVRSRFIKHFDGTTAVSYTHLKKGRSRQ